MLYFVIFMNTSLAYNLNVQATTCDAGRSHDVATANELQFRCRFIEERSLALTERVAAEEERVDANDELMVAVDEE